MIRCNPVIIDPSNGSKLSLFFKGGTVQPSASTENTVWINTAENIKTVYICWNAPKAPEVGDVWLKNGYQLSEDYEPIISADRVLTIYRHPTIGVAINGAKQWNGAEWVICGLSVYKGGAWVEIVPSDRILVADLPDGSLVRITENGAATNFIKLTSNYHTDAESATGKVLLLRERVYMQCDANAATYAEGLAASFLGKHYLGLFPEAVQNMVAEVPIQCDGELLTAKAFLLSATEMNLGQRYDPLGVGLEYFANNAQRCAYNDSNVQAIQLTRQLAYTGDGISSFFCVSADGQRTTVSSTTDAGIRPAFTIRWSDTYVDPVQNEDGSYTLIEEVGE